MKLSTLANIIKQYNYMELEQEQLNNNLSKDEEILLGWNIPTTLTKMTIEEFAKKYEGDSLSIYYKEGKQVGFCRLSQDSKRGTRVHPTMQNILFNIDIVENGLLTFDLNEYRNSTKV